MNFTSPIVGSIILCVGAIAFAGDAADAGDKPRPKNAGAVAFTPLGEWKVREGVGGLCFSPDGQRLYAVSGRPGVFRPSGELGIVDVRAGDVRQSPLGASYASAAVTRDGSKLVAGGEGGVIVVDLAGPKVIRRFPPADGDRIGPRVVGLVDRDRSIVTVNRKAIELRTADDDTTSRPLKPEAVAAVRAAALNADATKLATVTEQGVVHVWDVTTWEPVMTFAQDVRGFAVLINPPATVVYAHGVENLGQLVDVKTGKSLGRIEAQSVNAAAFSPDGSLLALGLHDGTVQLCDAATGRPLHRLRGFAGEPRNAVRALAFTRDGKRLAAATFDGRLRAWDLPPGPPGNAK